MKNKLFDIISKVFKTNKKNVKNFLSKVWKIILKPEMQILPGQLAFFVIISMVPIVTIVSLLGNMAGINVDTVTEFLNNIFTSINFDLILPNLFGKQLSIEFIIVIFITIFIASNGADSIIVASDQIYGIEHKSLVKRKIKALVLTLLLCVLYIFVLIVPLLGNKIMLSFNYFNLKHIIDPVLTIVNGPITWIILYWFLKSIYVLAPDKEVKKDGVNLGAIFSATGWVIATYFYGIWIKNFNSYDMYYGSLSSLAILMLWIYLLCYIFVIGLCLNVNVEKEEKERKEHKKNEKYELN